jgi:Peptidase family M28
MPPRSRESAWPQDGWHALLEDYPWFVAEGQYPLAAYSEFMPPPRLGRTAYGEVDPVLYAAGDPYGWNITEMEEVYELAPGLQMLANQIMQALRKLGQGESEHTLAGHEGRNLRDNPYWPAELAGHLPHEHYVLLLPLALSRTQDDMGRVRWTFFGASEQGPERAFWNSFYTAPGAPTPEQESLAFFMQLLDKVYREPVADAGAMLRAGFRILPTGTRPAPCERASRAPARGRSQGIAGPEDAFPYWSDVSLPSWTRSFQVDASSSFDDVRYLLTFTPFSRLPASAQQSYLAGKLHLLPFPGSLVFWGMPTFRHLQSRLPFAMQIPLQQLAARQGGPDGIRVPQTGWLHEPHPDIKPSQVQVELIRDRYHRTHRWNRVHRYDDELALNQGLDKVSKVLFSTESDSLGLYNKPMARNCQLWTHEFNLLLDGPNATRAKIDNAEAAFVSGGLFGYRFHFPAMTVGRHEVYWHRPLAAYWSPYLNKVEMLPDAPLGYLTAYRANEPDLAHPVELWPRMLRRPPYLAALSIFDPVHDHYVRQTPLNAISLLDNQPLLGAGPLPRSFARQLLRIAKEESLEQWLASLPQRAAHPEKARELEGQLEGLLAASVTQVSEPLTFAGTATRSFEEALWTDMLLLSHGRYVNKDNADVAQDPATQQKLAHQHRDLEKLGDYLLERYRKTIAAAGMEGVALCGDLPFHWHTDFDFPLFGGWRSNQAGKAAERDILVIIPGKDRSQAVVMADHYDTAYMEDMYEKEKGGEGVRMAAAGADDNHSATSTLLLAAPIFLQLAQEGRLERDIWLLHLTGEEFPADCLGARFFTQSLIEHTLKLRLEEGNAVDLSPVQVVAVFVMDMIAHNRDNAQDIFQISPGKGAASLQLAWQAHLANEAWNAGTVEWNERVERKGLGRGKRSAGGRTLPAVARHLLLHGEVRTMDDPQSSLYNTDGQIFSDAGIPVVLFMENYDINRVGYHDTHDTMELIDLDYGSAFAAIAIETVARVAGNSQRVTPSRAG